MDKIYRVVCAANMVDGFLILGLRHWDQKMHNQVKIIQRTYPTLDTKKTVQGFVDGYGTFLTREEAWKRATLTGQLDNYKGHNPGILFSEDLY